MKNDCKTIRAPFSDNYCRDWLAYHGGIFALGAGALLGGLTWEHSFIAFLGLMVMIVAPIAGLLNYLLDRNFRKG